jgi:multidrug transporter EmrE-like cation transporter
MGVLFYLGIPVIMLVNRMGPASVNWTFVNLGLIVPILAAPWLFHEPLLGIDALTLALFVLMLLAFARGMATDNETKPEHLLLYGLLLASALLNNGIAMTLLKEKAVLLGQNSSAGMGAIFYLSGGVLTALTALFTERGQRWRRVDLGIGALAGVCSGGAILLMFAAASLPAAVLFPITQGAGLLGGVLLTTVLYQERLTPFKTAGLTLGMAVLLLAGLRGTITAWLAGLLTR